MRRLIFALGVLALALYAAPAGAQQLCAGYGAKEVTPFAYEAVTVSSTAVGFTPATFDTGAARAVVAIATLETDSIRFRADGPPPTAAVGQLVTQSSNVSLTICGTSAIRAFRAIRTTGDASLRVVYYRTGN